MLLEIREIYGLFLHCGGGLLKLKGSAKQRINPSA
jgi:hypothetical protein